MANNQYSDLFEYSTLNKSTLEYLNVTLLKNMCGKKAGTYIDKIVLNPVNGKFTIPRKKSHKSDTDTAVMAVKPPVEFKGVHTRFEDNEDTPLDNTKVLDSFAFKIYEGRKIHKVVKYDDAYEELIQSICEHVSINDIEIDIDSKNSLVNISTSKNLHTYFDMKKRNKTSSGKYSFALTSLNRK